MVSYVPEQLTGAKRQGGCVCGDGLARLGLYVLLPGQLVKRRFGRYYKSTVLPMAASITKSVKHAAIGLTADLFAVCKLFVSQQKLGYQ